MTAVFNWGLLSTARINNAILSAMPQSERGTVLGVASREGERARAYADAKGLERAYDGYEAMLADPDIHIVYNGLPNSLHAEWTIRALEAGKHVLCEKPFAMTLPEVEAVQAAAQRAGRVAAEGFMYRHHPKILKLKELMDEGTVGEPRLLRAAFSFTLDRPNDVRWKPELGGGAIWDVGCYCISLARYLFGAPEHVRGWQVRAPSGVDGVFAGMLEFAGGRAAQFECGFQLPLQSQAELIGEKGVVRLWRPFQPSNPEAKISLVRGDKEEVLDLPNPQMYWMEIEDMHDAIITGAGPRITPAETRGHVETIVALLESAQRA
jgi:predicted dehydrogenase